MHFNRVIVDVDSFFQFPSLKNSLISFIDFISNQSNLNVILLERGEGSLKLINSFLSNEKLKANVCKLRIEQISELNKECSILITSKEDSQLLSRVSSALLVGLRTDVPNGSKYLLVNDFQAVREMFIPEYSSNIHKLLSKNTDILKRELLNKYKLNINHLNDVLIFGAQNLGAKLLEQFERAGINVIGFIDNDKRKIGSEFKGKVVYSLDDISNQHMIVVASTTYLGEIMKQLKDLNYSHAIPCQILPLCFKELFPDIEPAFSGIHEDLTENRDKYLNLFFSLDDSESKKVLNNLIGFRFHIDPFLLKPSFKEEYFDEDLLILKDKEVFVDGGGCKGAVTAKFISKVKNFKSVYVFEPDKSLVMQMRKVFSDYKNIHIVGKGLYSENKVAYFNATGGLDGSISITGTEKVELVKLDDFLTVVPTFIKLDVEGAELQVLHGAKNHIKQSKPKMAIALYHQPSDLWKLPEAIIKMNPEYKFYLRHYSDSIFETILYCIPE